MEIRHIPVLKKEIYENLPKTLDLYVDWTTGHAGHIIYILDNHPNKNKIKVICYDVDNLMLEKAKKYLTQYNNEFVYINESYSALEHLNKIWSWKVDYILLDLWVNLEHFKDKVRGFSIKYDEQLDMRFDTKQAFTAKKMIDSYKEEQLKRIFVTYWDFSENFSLKLAMDIIKNKNIINTTFDLKNVLRQNWLNEKKIAVIFQCIRIEVNNELKRLEEFLDKFDTYLSNWWRCAIITYHSIEDRLVKNKFKELSTKNYKLVNKHVIKPTYQETLSNPAAKSAKLRIIEAL